MRNILHEYGHVTPQISPNLILNTNININEYVMAGPTEIGRDGHLQYVLKLLAINFNFVLYYL